MAALVLRLDGDRADADGHAADGAEVPRQDGHVAAVARAESRLPLLRRRRHGRGSII